MADMTTKVRQIVRETLEEKFPKIKIVGINVSEHKDDEGGLILEIRVIFEAGKDKFDPKEIGELPRLIIPKLDKAKETGFPVFSFISKSDWGNRNPEAA